MDLEIIKIAEKSVNNRPIKNRTHFQDRKIICVEMKYI